MIAPTDAQNIIVLEMFVAWVMKIKNCCLADFNVGYFRVNQVIRSNNFVDGLNLWLISSY